MFYLNSFFLFSIIGWSYETIFHLIEGKIKQNILFGPWMPIYGIGILVIELIHKSLKKLKINGKKRILYNLIISTTLLTILEGLGGILIEFLFSTSFWNYSSLPLSIGTYMNLFVSIIWGLLGLFINYILYPLLTPWIKKIPKWVSLTCLTLFLLDNIINISLKLDISFLNKSLTFMRFISQ